jgi:hypothetical protein
MVEINAVEIAATLGMLSGVLAICMAVFLQLLYTKHVPLKYVAFFYLLGSGMMLLNVTPPDLLWSGTEQWLPVIGNAVILAAELIGFRWVIEEVEAFDSADVRFPHAE